MLGLGIGVGSLLNRTVSGQLLPNGDFSQGISGWSKLLPSDGAVVSSGSLTITNNTGAAFIYNSFPSIVGQEYQIEVVVESLPSGSYAITAGTSNADVLGLRNLRNLDSQSTVGLITTTFTATETLTYISVAGRGVPVSSVVIGSVAVTKI